MTTFMHAVPGGNGRKVVAPPLPATWPWLAAQAKVTDAFGGTWTAQSQDGRLELPVSGTPLFAEQ